MNPLRPFTRRLRALFRNGKLDREMSEEMRAHLTLLAAENERLGMAPDEARCAAQRSFGGIEQIKERCRDQRGWTWLDQLRQDIGYGVRSLRKTPGFTAVAVLSLALGIGAGTAIFSLLNAVLLRSLPVRAPHELRVIHWSGLNPRLSNYTGNNRVSGPGAVVVGSSFPYPAYREYHDRGPGFAALFAFYPLPRVNVIAGGDAATVSGLMVSGNFFASYGASALIGRPLAPEDDRPGAAPVAVITYGLWEQRFGLDPHALGQTLTLDQNAFTIIGVLPRDYVGPMPGDLAQFYVSFAAQPTLVPTRPLDSVDNWWVQIMARVLPGADEQQAQAALAVQFRQVLAASKTKMDRPGIVLEAGAQGAGSVMRERMAKPLLALLAVVGLVVAVACANVAGLLLARGAARGHEFAVRAALGAGRGRLVRQSLTESLLLGLAAGGGGLIVAGWGKAVLLGSLGTMPDNFRFDLRTDLRVFAFALGVSVLTALICGLLPAWRASRVDPLAGLKSRSALAAPRLRLGRMLVAVQVGFSVLLVVGAFLMVRTFVNLVRVDPGFNPENVLLFRVDPGKSGYKGAALNQFYAESRRSLEAIPGVRAVALTSLALASDSSNSNGIVFPDRPAITGEQHQAGELTVSDGYFAMLGIPMVLGREFAGGDTATSLPVAVVNETFARTFFPGENPLGRTFGLSHDRTRVFAIIGVNRDAKFASLRETVPPVMSFCFRQQERTAMVFAIRSILPPLSLVPAARQAIAALNPHLPLSAIRTQAQLVSQSVAFDRLVAGLCGGLGGLALLLACLGLYGLMAYHVTRRTGEIGIRMALGASRRDIAWPIVREALWLAGAGLVVGIPLAWALARVVKNQLYGIAPHDPVAFAAGGGLLVIVAVIAAGVPARRASRIDPIKALRAE